MASWSGANMTPHVEVNHVEARVLVGQRLGVAHLERDLDALLGRPFTRRVDERGRQILPHDVRAAPGGENRDGARAGGRIEHLVAGLRIDALDRRARGMSRIVFVMRS